MEMMDKVDTLLNVLYELAVLIDENSCSHGEEICSQLYILAFTQAPFSSSNQKLCYETVIPVENQSLGLLKLWLNRNSYMKYSIRLQIDCILRIHQTQAHLSEQRNEIICVLNCNIQCNHVH